jgi:VanZ family protein
MLSTTGRWWVWLLYVVAWTTALLVPVPTTGNWDLGDTEIDLRFVIAKTVHVSAYALLAALTAWLRAPVRWRFLLMFFLMLHGTLTEMVQWTIESLGRTGELRDVAIDNAGIAIGMVLTWRLWAEDERSTR